MPEVKTILEDEDGVDYAIDELYAAVEKSKDIILTISRDQVEDLKKGLSVKKSKENTKLENAGLIKSRETFKYTVYDDDTTKGTENTKLRIALKERKGFNILKMELPDDNL